MITGLDPDPLKTGIVTPLVKTIFWDRRGDRRRDVDCCRIPREHASRHYSAGREEENGRRIAAVSGQINFRRRHRNDETTTF